MRTTSTIDDNIARQLKEIVQRSGKPFTGSEASAAFALPAGAPTL